MTKKRLLPDDFPVIETTTAKEILEEQAKLLEETTKGVVYARVMGATPVPVSIVSNRNFEYSFTVCGRYVNYQYMVMTFWHSSDFYPVFVTLDSDIAKEVKENVGLSVEPGTPATYKLEDVDEIQDFLEKVFNSDKFKKIVGGIIKLSGA
ncbi:MAG: hypothetical protein NUW37_16625 [Planctomycetes bacterium]|nr:hypothetical protein [Planctomycetota bacterium]